MPYEDAEVPLLGYYGQYEAAKNDPQVPIPTLWTYPAEVVGVSFKNRTNTCTFSGHEVPG